MSMLIKPELDGDETTAVLYCKTSWCEVIPRLLAEIKHTFNIYEMIHIAAKRSLKGRNFVYYLMNLT